MEQEKQQDKDKEVDRTLVFSILEIFAKEEKWNIGLLFLVSTLCSVLQTNGISYITSNLINSIQSGDTNKSTNIWFYYKFLIAGLVGYLILYYCFYYLQNLLLTKMRPWARHKMLEFLLTVNSDSFSEINFTRLNSPIHRVADLICSIMSDIIGYVLPNFMYLVVTTCYFLYLSPVFGVIFLIGNIILFSFFLSQYTSLLHENENYESEVHHTDSYMIDILNNVDKIVYRGQTPKEVEEFGKVSDKNRISGFKYYKKTNDVVTTMLFIVLSIVLISLAYMIYMFLDGKISSISFIG